MRKDLASAETLTRTEDADFSRLLLAKQDSEHDCEKRLAKS